MSALYCGKVPGPMEALAVSAPVMLEHPGYVQVGSEHLYAVVHEVQKPIARILLAGPFAAERHHAYLPWVRWARYLAARRFEVMRFDYRGVGESTGTFEEMSFTEWSQDIAALMGFLSARLPQVPTFLHGLSLGALLAAHVFEQDLGEGLLLWSPPESANRVLRTQLASWAALQALSSRSEQRRPMTDYIRTLDEGCVLEVNGYRWSPRLWHDSYAWQLPAGYSASAPASSVDGRPMHSLTLTRQASPLVRGGLAGYEEGRDLDWLFAPNFAWLSAAAAALSSSTA